jgi:hypothetical protein
MKVRLNEEMHDITKQNQPPTLMLGHVSYFVYLKNIWAHLGRCYDVQ